MSTIWRVFRITSAGDLELLAVYSTRDRAQSLINAQPEHRSQVRLMELELDQHPLDETWARPS
jgi:hypothetical protein